VLDGSIDRIIQYSDPLVSIHDRIATPESKRRYVRWLFATIADRYDLITVLLSYGRDRHWKKRLIDLARPLRDNRALDLATGTGDIAFAMWDRGARVVGLDVTRQMIELARAKRSSSFTRSTPGPSFLVGDMLALPFPADSFDLVTAGYGLRNVPDLGTAIDEMRRVLRPGGQALSLDFNRPTNRLVRGLYLSYLTVVGSVLGWLLHRDPDTYRYIPASIRKYPGAEAVVRLMEARGFARVTYYPVLGGLMAIHQAWKDGREG
jgi:ubiquinone/menaquinone biosynthesis methyltransferase